MKALLFTMEYPPFKGGVANYYDNMQKNWPEADGLEVLFKKYLPSPFQYLMYFKDLRQIVKDKGISHILVGQILPLGTVVYFFSLLFRKSYSIFLHGMDLPLALATPRKRWLTKRMLKRSQKIICGNSYVARLVKDFAPTLTSKIIVVNPGVGEALPVKEEMIESLRKRYGLVGNKVMLSVGRLVKRKGVDTVLEALSVMDISQIGNWRYVVLGTGPDETYLKNICHQRGLDDLVVFVGPVSEEEKWAWLNLSDFLVMATRDIAGDFEGFGIVYLEANLVGKPVLATNSGGVADAVSDGENGLLVESDDIVSGLERLMNDPALRDSLGQKGCLRAKIDFNWAIQAKKIYLAINS